MNLAGFFLEKNMMIDVRRNNGEKWLTKSFLEKDMGRKNHVNVQYFVYVSMLFVCCTDSGRWVQTVHGSGTN